MFCSMPNPDEPRQTMGLAYLTERETAASVVVLQGVKVGDARFHGWSQYVSMLGNPLFLCGQLR